MDSLDEVIKGDILRCPNCESILVKEHSKRATYKDVALVGLLGSSISLWIPIIGWIAFPFMLLLLIISSVIFAYYHFTENKSAIRCMKCGAVYEGPRYKIDELLKRKRK